MKIAPLAFAMISVLLVGQICRAENKGLKSGVPVLIFETVGKYDRSDESLPLVKKVIDKKRLKKVNEWISKDGPQLGLILLSIAREVRGQKNEDFAVILSPGGNFPCAGYRIQKKDRIVEHPNSKGIILDESERTFRQIFNHETAHIALMTLNDGYPLPRHGFETITHSNGVITDRTTAMNEGFAISTETITGHRSSDPDVRSYVDHRQMDLSLKNPGEYTFLLSDTLNPAQTFDRYVGVRDNHFSFDTTPSQETFFAALFDRTRDWSSPRDANTLLATEGFYASYFFRLADSTIKEFDAKNVRSAYRPIFETLAEIFSAKKNTDQKIAADTPWIAEFVNHYKGSSALTREQALILLFDLSHGAFFQPEFKATWKQLYGIALNKDFENFRPAFMKLIDDRKKLITSALENPNTLYERVGPVLRVLIPAKTVKTLSARELPLEFDLNSVPRGILRLIPKISADEINRFLEARDKQPFKDSVDFNKRAGLSKETLELIRFSK